MIFFYLIIYIVCFVVKFFFFFFFFNIFFIKDPKAHYDPLAGNKLDLFGDQENINLIMSKFNGNVEEEGE
jgi:hypothetical protein